MRNLLLICDRERSYALHLMEYIYQNGDLPCEIRVCTEPEKLRDSGLREQTVLLAAAESALREAGGAQEYGAVLILTEDGAGTGDLPLPSSVQRIGKYSPSPVLLARIRQMFLEAGPVLPGRIRTAEPMRIIGVYSPVGGCLQTTLALTAGRILAEETAAGGAGRRVLYMNLEPLSGLQARIGHPVRGNLKDLLYYDACSEEKTASQIRLLRMTEGGLDILPPMRSWLGLRDIRGEAWLHFLDTISAVTEYEDLILDLTEHADGFVQLLRRCSEILMPVREDPAALAKERQLEEILEEQEAGDVWGRIRRFIWPPEVIAQIRREPRTPDLSGQRLKSAEADTGLPLRIADMAEGGAAEWVRTFLKREGLFFAGGKNCGNP